MNSAPSPLKSFLSPEVIANTNLYDQKIDCGEIRVIYAPGKHYEIEYCNPADEPALSRLHKSGPLRFVEDPTRTHFLPPLRTFGKNPYIPPTTGELNTARPNTDLLITDHSPSAPSAPSSSEPSSENQPAAPSAPIGPIGPISETTNPPAQSEATNPPAASANPAPAPLTRDQRLAEFYKGMAAQARETLQMLNARRARLEQEAQNENHEPQNTEH